MKVVARSTVWIVNGVVLSVGRLSVATSAIRSPPRLWTARAPCWNFLIAFISQKRANDSECAQLLRDRRGVDRVPPRPRARIDPERVVDVGEVAARRVRMN